MERRLHQQVQAVPRRHSLRSPSVLPGKTEGLNRLELFQQPLPIAQRLTAMREAQFQKDFVGADRLAGRNIFANLLH